MRAGDSSCGIAAGLRAIVERCCRQRNLKDPRVVNALIALTPLSAALTLAAAASRICGIIGDAVLCSNLKQ